MDDIRPTFESILEENLVQMRLEGLDVTPQGLWHSAAKLLAISTMAIYEKQYALLDSQSSR